jgi:lysophospholipase L1-like esterase
MHTLVCLGDSLTEGADIAPQYRWTALSANMLGIRITNKGIGGDTSAGLVSRLYHDVINPQADMVLILAGTNDIWWGVDVNLVLANIFTIACQAQYHHIAPIIGTPLPFHQGLLEASETSAPAGGIQACRESLTTLSRRLAEAASEYDIPCIAYHRLFTDDQNEVLAQYFLEDGLHLNKQGHLRMAQETARCFKLFFCFS